MTPSSIGRSGPGSNAR